MAYWELVEVKHESCDICGSLASANVYRKLIGTKLYRFINVCGSCLNEWLKKQSQYKELD